MSHSTPEINWQVAIDHFAGKPNRKDEVLHLPKISTATGQQPSHSYIQFNDKPYAITPRVAGQGQFGVVKFCQSQGGTEYAVKIQNKSNARYVDNEMLLGKDVGLVIDSGVSNVRTDKEYSLMPNLGITLADFLKAKPDLQTRLDYAIKLCLEVSQHHHGLNTKSGQNICHRDLKPANIMVKTKDHQIKLTDYGLSEANKAKSRPRDRTGTPYYLPYTAISSHTYEELDALALKRCIYMPSQLYLRTDEKDYGLFAVSADIPSFFSRFEMLKFQLITKFDTSSRSPTYHSALSQGALLILASLNLSSHYITCASDVSLQKALYVLHKADVLDEAWLTKLILEPNEKTKLAKLWPLLTKVPNAYLKLATEQDNIYTLLLDISKQTRATRERSCQQLQQHAAESLTDLAAINQLRSALKLTTTSEPVILPKLATANEAQQPSSKATLIGQYREKLHLPPLGQFHQPQPPATKAPPQTANRQQKLLQLMAEYRANQNAQKPTAPLAPKPPKVIKHGEYKIVTALLKNIAKLNHDRVQTTNKSSRFITAARDAYQNPNERIAQSKQFLLMMKLRRGQYIVDFTSKLKEHFKDGESPYDIGFNTALINALKETIQEFEPMSFSSSNTVAAKQIQEWLENQIPAPAHQAHFRF